MDAWLKFLSRRVCNGGLEEIQMNQQNWEGFYQTPAAAINMPSFPALYNGEFLGFFCGWSFVFFLVYL